MTLSRTVRRAHDPAADGAYTIRLHCPVCGGTDLRRYDGDGNGTVSAVQCSAGHRSSAGLHVEGEGIVLDVCAWTDDLEDDARPATVTQLTGRDVEGRE